MCTCPVTVAVIFDVNTQIGFRSRSSDTTDGGPADQPPPRAPGTTRNIGWEGEGGSAEKGPAIRLTFHVFPSPRGTPGGGGGGIRQPGKRVIYDSSAGSAAPPLLTVTRWKSHAPFFPWSARARAPTRHLVVRSPRRLCAERVITRTLRLRLRLRR